MRRPNPYAAVPPALCRHVLDALDGRKRPPHVVHRVHRLCHVGYYGSAALGFYHLHEYGVYVVFAMELLSILLSVYPVAALEPEHGDIDA